MSIQGMCALCGQVRTLRQSHVAPDFVRRLVLAAALTDDFRQLDTPNVPRQQMRTYALLCEGCEQTISRWERQFRQHIFAPLYERWQQTFQYGDWLLRFHVSLGLRILARELDRRARQGKTIPAYVEEAARIWRSYLLAERVDPGPYDHHIAFALPRMHDSWCDLRGTLDLPPFLTWELCGTTIDPQLIMPKEEAFMYTNLGGVLLVSCIRPRRQVGWKNTLVLSSGTLDTAKQAIGPDFRNWLVERMQAVRQRRALLSPRQLERDNKKMAAALERAVQVGGCGEDWSMAKVKRCIALTLKSQSEETDR